MRRVLLRRAPDWPRDILEKGDWTSLFLEHELNPSIARKPAAETKAALRRTLIETRREAALDADGKAALGRRVLDALKRFEPVCVGFYWPLAGEFDARGAMAIWLSGDARRRASLPVIKNRNAPLEFHAWTPATPMQTGHHTIPEPMGTAVVVPDLLFVPCVGFDDDGYRLGYGGGYYDRTLAAWPDARRPVTVGVAWEACRASALDREAHDIPLDLVITDQAVYPPQTKPAAATHAPV